MLNTALLGAVDLDAALDGAALDDSADLDAAALHIKPRVVVAAARAGSLNVSGACYLV